MTDDSEPKPAKAARALPQSLEAWATVNPNRSITLRLDVPVQLGELTVDALEIQRPKGKHLRDLGEGDGMDDTLQLLARLSGQSDRVLDLLDVDDVLRATEAVGFFFPAGRKGGKRR